MSWQAQLERQRDARSRDQEDQLTEAKRAMAARWRCEREERQRVEAEAKRRAVEMEAAARQAELEQRQAINKLRLQMCKEDKVFPCAMSGWWAK